MSKIAFKDQLNSLLKQLDPFIDKIDSNSKLLIELARYIIRIIDNTPNNYHINILNQFKQNYHIILNKYSSVLNYSFAIHNQDNITNDTLNALYEHIKTKLTELNNLYSTNSISIPKNVVLNDFNANIIHSNQPTNKNTTNNKLTSTECNFRPQKIANNNNLTGVQSTDDIKINYIAPKTPQNVIPEESKSAEIDSKAQVPPASEPTTMADDNDQTPQNVITEESKSAEIDSKAQVPPASEPTKVADDNAQTPQKGITEGSKSTEIDSKAQVLSTSEPTKMADDNAQTPQKGITEESKSAEIDSKAQVLSTSEPTKVADDNASTKTTSDIGVQTLIHQKEPTIELTLKYNGIINNNSYHDTITDMENMIKDYPIIHSSYNSKISTKFFVYNDYSIIKCEGNDFLVNELGLKVEVKPNINIITLSETPKKGYDGKLYFNIAISNISNGGPRTFSKDIYIAPDPKSLWQDLPVDDFDGYETPNDTKEAIKIEAIDKIVIAASCRGRSHAHVGKPRDDSFAINIDKDSGWNIVAVADGAGSAKYSRKGSEIACQTVIKELMEILKSDEFNNYLVINNDIMINWRNIFNSDIYKNYKDIDNNYRNQTVFDKIFYKSVYTAYDNILNEAKTRGAKIRDYHTTLLFMAFKKFDFGYFYGSFWIGDGAMAIYNINADNKVLVLGAPDSGEFAGQTRFLTMSEEIKPEFIKKRTCFGFVDDFEAIILATDGITDPFFPSDACVASEEKWKEFWDKTLKLGDEENPGCPKVFDRQVSLEDKAQDLRNWLDFWSKGNHDDRTILIVK